MANDRIIRSIVEKCDFLYDDALLSDEKIIEKYLMFFARQFDPTERSVAFAFHTGSLCFDVVSVAALMIGCLAYEFSSNDEILAELELGDMVLYKGERYRWGGIEKMSWNPDKPQTDYIILKQDAKGLNGPSSDYIPYEQNKHLIKPYFGTSSITDGRGIRRNKTNRNEFISYILGISIADVPSALDLSVVVVAEKNEFIEICKHLKIKYNVDKTVALMDVVPVSYFTGTGEEFQIGNNASKAEAVIKITSKISIARELVFDKNGNKVIGLMVANVEALSDNLSELNDLLRRKILKFAYVVTPFNSNFCDWAMEQYESAKMFACTKELLTDCSNEIKSVNKLTEELNRQVFNILTNKIQTVKVTGCWDWEQYKKLKEKLYAIKQANWTGEDRDNFILSTMALINLFNTAFFSMSSMERVVSSGKVNLTVISPKVRISGLKEIAARAISMRDKCFEIISLLQEMFCELYDCSPKEKELLQFLRSHQDAKIAIVVPKAYYSEIFDDAFHKEFVNVTCVTANRFDKLGKYDIVIATGDITGKRFDAIHCYAAPTIILFLYDYEEKIFLLRKRKAAKSEQKINARIKGLKGEEYFKAVETADNDDFGISEQTLHEFSDLDDFVDSVGMFDIRKLTVARGSSGDYHNTAEVQYVGIFTTGEQILFSKYYSAVVLNYKEGIVTEKSPNKLSPGDILVFTKRNDYTSNIVDQIFDQLMRTKRLNMEVQDAAEKAFYWKAVLRKYKDSNGLTYKAVAQTLKKYGSSLQEVTIRQWLIEESHIIGPRDAKTMKIIAEMTKDPYLLSNPDSYFEACRIVRHYRREILVLIARAINDKLSNNQPIHGSELEVVYENVEKLSETMELEDIFELNEVAIVNNAMVNRPISESEVLM